MHSVHHRHDGTGDAGMHSSGGKHSATPRGEHSSTEAEHDDNGSHKAATKATSSNSSKIRVHNKPHTHAKKAQQQEWRDSKPDSRSQQQADDGRGTKQGQPTGSDRGELESDEFSSTPAEADREAVEEILLSPEGVLFRLGGSDAADGLFLGDDGNYWLGHVQDQLSTAQQDLDYEQPGESAAPFDAITREGADVGSEASDSGAAGSRGSGGQGPVSGQPVAAGKWRWALDDMLSRSGPSLDDMLARAEDEPDWPDEEAE
jgi:hypothetical protein